MNRCTGHCCRAFTVSSSLDVLAELANNGDEQAAIVFDMVIPIPLEADVSAIDPDATPGVQRYECRHFDPRSGNCTNYEGRPIMCRDYPYEHMENGCQFSQCTLPNRKLPVLNG